jgi:hypothetical protein
MLLQIIHAVLVKGLIEAALIALSIFFLSPFLTLGAFSFYQIYAIRYLFLPRNRPLSTTIHGTLLNSFFTNPFYKALLS